MQGPNRKAEILDSRGKKVPLKVGNVLVEPNSRGGCSVSKLVTDDGHYRFILVEGIACDSVTKWTVMVDGSTESMEHRWHSDGPFETPWMRGEVLSHSWSLLGPPSVPAMVWNLSRAMARAVSTGFKTVKRPILEHRLSVCRGCPYWEENARFGLGKCNHVECGCTRSKLWLATESCPQKLWLPVTEDETEVLTE